MLAKKGSFIPYLTFDSSFFFVESFLLNLINSKGRDSFQNCYYEAETKNRKNRTVARATNRFKNRFFIDQKALKSFKSFKEFVELPSKVRVSQPSSTWNWSLFFTPDSANEFDSRGRKKYTKLETFWGLENEKKYKIIAILVVCLSLIPNLFVQFLAILNGSRFFFWEI